MYKELISRLLSLSEIDEIDAIQQEPGICRITMECIGAIKDIAIEAANAIEELSKRIDRAVERYNRDVERSAMYEALVGIAPQPPKEENNED